MAWLGNGFRLVKFNSVEFNSCSKTKHFNTVVHNPKQNMLRLHRSKIGVCIPTEIASNLEVSGSSLVSAVVFFP